MFSMGPGFINTGIVVTGATWNPADKGSNIVLSTGNRELSSNTTSWGTARGTTSKNSGKWYFEIKRKYAGTAGVAGCGVGNASASLSNYPGSDANGWAYLSDGYKAHAGFSALAPGYDSNGAVMMVAVDITAGNIWFGVNGTWVGSGNPATAANPVFTGVTGTLFPFGGEKQGTITDSITAQFTAASQTYAAPSGFSSWA